jgi:hypothetical protein
VEFVDTPEQAGFRSEVRAFIEERYEPLWASIKAEADEATSFAVTPTKQR